ncbi:MAG: DNA-3-methyladenine glycosylase, partial [Candidatus Sungbacteria bacterium]|nr:DNA-3-methyladenine glycosylase [Candidatus Sungbacteria bacterium]
MKLCNRAFFQQNARIVARELLGKYLVRRIGKKVLSYMIVETEAYVGPQDQASHAYRGRTKRNEVMFGPA